MLYCTFEFECLFVVTSSIKYLSFVEIPSIVDEKFINDVGFALRTSYGRFL